MDFTVAYWFVPTPLINLIIMANMHGVIAFSLHLGNLPGCLIGGLHFGCMLSWPKDRSCRAWSIQIVRTDLIAFRNLFWFCNLNSNSYTLGESYNSLEVHRKGCILLQNSTDVLLPGKRSTQSLSAVVVVFILPEWKMWKNFSRSTVHA